MRTKMPCGVQWLNGDNGSNWQEADETKNSVHRSRLVVPGSIASESSLSNGATFDRLSINSSCVGGGVNLAKLYSSGFRLVCAGLPS